MKLRELIKHIPVYQYLRLREMGSIVAMGYPGKPNIEKHLNKTVSLIRISDGTLEVSVYSTPTRNMVE